MKIRIIRLLNNYDQSDKALDIMEEDRKIALGTWCVFGHFDALEVEDAVEVEEGKIWQQLAQNKFNRSNDEPIANKRLNFSDGTCIEHDLVCVVREQKDEQSGQTEDCFWKKANENPFLFISAIHLTSPIQSAELDEILKEYNDALIFYLSYGHNEITAVTYSDFYYLGIEKIKSLQKKLRIEKINTVFAVREEQLGSCGASEKVNCRWQGSYKSDEKVKYFAEELADALKRTEGNPLMYYDQLGNHDILIEANDVLLADVLPLYKAGSLMTHTNHIYMETWVNIETTFLLPEGNVILAKEEKEEIEEA